MKRWVEMYVNLNVRMTAVPTHLFPELSFLPPPEWGQTIRAYIQPSVSAREI